jgi:hypothetical protein
VSVIEGKITDARLPRKLLDARPSGCKLRGMADKVQLIWKPG